MMKALMILVNILGFVLCLIDKKRARVKKRRIPEAFFFFLGFIGGAFSILAAMRLFHHKTRKNSFKRIIYVDAFVSILLLYEVFIRQAV